MTIIQRFQESTVSEIEKAETESPPSKNIDQNPLISYKASIENGIELWKKIRITSLSSKSD